MPDRRMPPSAVLETGAERAAGDPRRWLILATVALAQLMIVLDLTVVNIALPSAQRSLHFATVDRQWVVTAYALAFGSLLLLGGRLADLLSRKVTFMAGLAGFAAVSAVGGAATSFAMLVTARACQGVFAAVMAPSALSVLTNTFQDPKDRGKAFGVFGAIAGAGGAVGLLLGGALTEFLSWRWTLFVNLVFAGVALAGATVLLKREPARGGQRLDLAGAVLVGGAMFCLVYGCSNAATHNWHTPSAYGFLAAGVIALAAFTAWQARAKAPLLPPRIVLDRNRGGAYLAMLFAGAGMFGIFLFTAYYLQTTLRYSPVVTGFAFLPMVAILMVSASVGQIVLMPRTGPKPLTRLGMLIAAAGMVWLTRLGVHSGYASAILGPLLVTAAGLGQVIAPALNTGTFGVAPHDAGVASATINVGQQLGGSIGTALLNTVVAAATATYLTSHLNPATIVAGHSSPALAQQSLVHGYTVGFWWTAGIFTLGAVVCGTLLRRGPLDPQRGHAATASVEHAGKRIADATVGNPTVRGHEGSQPMSCSRSGSRAEAGPPGTSKLEERRPMMPLSTARLVLRRPEESDVEPLMAMNADPEVMRYIGSGAIIPPDRDRVLQAVTRWRKQWDEQGFGMCSVIVRETGEYAGWVTLAVPFFLPEILPAVEIGFRLSREHWGHGYATEAATELLRFGLTGAGLDRVVSIRGIDNTRSERVMDKLGLRFELQTTVPATGQHVAVHAIAHQESGRTARLGST